MICGSARLPIFIGVSPGLAWVRRRLRIVEAERTFCIGEKAGSSLDVALGVEADGVRVRTFQSSMNRRT
jgi:hypothetical protein